MDEQERKAAEARIEEHLEAQGRTADSVRAVPKGRGAYIVTVQVSDPEETRYAVVTRDELQ